MSQVISNCKELIAVSPRENGEMCTVGVFSSAKHERYKLSLIDNFVRLLLKFAIGLIFVNDKFISGGEKYAAVDFVYAWNPVVD